MKILRRADPSKAQCVWDAISYLKSQKIPCENEKTVKELIKCHGSTASEWEKCIKDMLSDHLLGENNREETKMSVLTMPTGERSILDKRDWYCFECHKPGDVKFCETDACTRVFHADCIPKNSKNIYILFHKLISNSGFTIFLKKGKLNRIKSLDLSFDETENERSDYDYKKCGVCNLNRMDNFSMDKTEFKTSLKFVHSRSRAWVPENVTHRMNGAEPYPEWITENDLNLRAKKLFFRHMDMSTVAENIENDHYSKFSQYLTDILTIRHNIGIFHGCESQEYEAAEFVLRDVFHDLGEIVSCLDCFKHSSETLVTEWFSLPCSKPHEIVWAKQKGFCYWPAKVIKKIGTIYDVRFFGGKHERAIVNQESIKPVTAPRKSLKLKNSCSLKKAINEMELLLKFMESRSDVETYISAESKARENDKPLKKRRSYVRKSPVKKRENLGKECVNDTVSKDDEKPVLNFKKPVRVHPDSESAVPIKKRKPSRTSSFTKKPASKEETIKISDDDDNIYTFSGSLTKSAMEFSDSTEDHEVSQVTSSTETEDVEEAKCKELPQLNQHYSKEVETMQNVLRGMSRKEDIIKSSMDIMQREINALLEKQREELKKVFERHRIEISETKKKQWCYFCEQDAIYHCCWNTAYCSVECQKQHWEREHKQACRRKR